MNTNLNKSTGFKTAAIASSIAVLMTLAACGEKIEDRTAGQQLDSAVAKTEQVANEAKADASTSMANAESAMKQAGQDIKQGAQTVGAKVDDAAITAAVNAAFVRDADLSALKIDVDTKAGVVSLFGPAPSAAARERATTLAKSVAGVTSVNNQLTIAAS